MSQAISDALMKANVEFTGFSCDGVNLFGDAKSIEALKRWHHDAGIVPALKDEIQTNRNTAKINLAVAKDRGRALDTLEKIYAEKVADLQEMKDHDRLTKDYGEHSLRLAIMTLEEFRRVRQPRSEP